MENSEYKIQDNKNSRNFIERIKSREDMTNEEFNDFMKLSLEQAENGESVSVDSAFNELLSIFKQLSYQILKILRFYKKSSFNLKKYLC